LSSLIFEFVCDWQLALQIKINSSDSIFIEIFKMTPEFLNLLQSSAEYHRQSISQKKVTRKKHFSRIIHSSQKK